MAARHTASWPTRNRVNPKTDFNRSASTSELEGVVKEKACGSRGVDTPFALLESSLSQMRARRPDAKFLTVSGDLIAHDFQCRFQKLLPQSTPRAYQAFTVKTFQFGVEELRATFPGVPV